MFGRTVRLAWPLFALHLATVGQTTSSRIVEIDEIKVTGTRVPASSIISLSGLKPHERLNELAVHTACHKVTSTGLFKSIDYTYDAYPDHPGVVLNLAVVDEGPLLPVSIRPAAEEAAVWTALDSMDSALMRQMPPTEKAIAFYEKQIQKYLQAQRRNDEYAAGNVLTDPQGKLTAIVFEIRKYKTLRSKE